MSGFGVMACDSQFSLHSLVIAMDGCSEHVHRSPVLTSSTRRLFSTPVVVDNAGHATQSIVTPATQAGLDPLMRLVLQTPLLSLTPTFVETPLGESYTHVSMLYFMQYF
jgi:hypothetical protein